MNPILAGVIAGIAAITVEAAFLKLPQLPWLTLFLLTLPAQMLVNYGIFQIVRGDSVLAVAIFFSGTTALLRLGLALTLGSPVSHLTWVAYSMSLCAMLIKIGEGLVSPK